LRAAGGIIAGLIIAFIVAIVATIISFGLHPLPRGIDPRKAAELAQYYVTIPATSFAVIVAGRFLAGLLGGLAANAIAGRTWPAWIIGVILAVYMLLEVLTYPHPLWVQAAGIAGPLAGAFIATRLAGRGQGILEDQEEVQHDAVSEL
jgi:hypothetical protein